MNHGKSRAICILGMHRSGTSTITRALNLVGAYLGDEKDLIAPAPDNIEGFWELKDIVDLDDRILHHFKMSWDASHPLPEGWYLTSELRPLKKEAVDLINRHFSGCRLWAWKDPRTTVLFDFWKDAVREARVDLAALFAVRNPLDVARSLEKRNGIPQQKGFGIWFNFNISGLMKVADVRLAFISYDRFLSDWEGELKRCAVVLGIPWPDDDSGLKSEMRKFIRADLRHSYSGLKELKESGASRPVVELYELLVGLTNETLDADEMFFQKIKDLYEEYCSYSGFYRADAESLWESERLLAEKERQIMELERKLEVQECRLGEKDRRMLELESSYSWRVTSPMRAIVKMLKH